MALKIKEKYNKKIDTIVESEILKIEQEDFSRKNISKINDIEDFLKKEFESLNSNLEQLSTINFKISNTISYNLLINLELLEKTLNKYHLLTKNSELAKEKRELYCKDILMYISEKYNIKFNFIDLLSYGRNKQFFPLKDLRNSVSHSIDIKTTLESIKKELIKRNNKEEKIPIKTTVFRYILRKEKEDLSFLIDKIVEKIILFNSLNKKSNKEEVVILVSELRELILWYGHSCNGDDISNKSFTEISVDKIQKKHLSKDTIEILKRLNSIRNNLIHSIIENTNHTNHTNHNVKMEFKIKALINNLNFEVIKNGLNLVLFDICKIEVKNERNIEQIESLLKTNSINTEQFSKEQKKELDKISNLLEHLEEKNLTQILIDINTLIDDGFSTNYDKIKQMMGKVKEDEINDTLYGFFNTIKQRINQYEKTFSFNL